MKNNIFKYYRRYYLGYSIVILLLIIFIFLIYQPSQSILAHFFISGRKIINTATTEITRFTTAFERLNNLEIENNYIKQENIKLLNQVTELSQLQNENKELLAQINYVKNVPERKYLSAYIYAKDPLNFSDVFSLDKGYSDNIRLDQAVVYNGLYLGKIISLTTHTSQVKLITSPEQIVSANIPSANTNGLIKGQIGYSLELTDVPPDAKLTPGQVVVTSNLSPNIPSNLILGEISQVNRRDQDIFQQATIKPMFDIKNIKYVLIDVTDQNKS